MEFYQLETFVMVVGHRSFSRAAEILFLSQPTVSAHVKNLETELGMPLFDRGKSELLLTQAGESLYRYARDMLDMRTVALAELQGGGELGEETLIVAASSVPCQYLLPRAVAAFETQYPAVSVSLRQENSRQACEDVFRYHYPLGVVGEKSQLPHLVFEPILEDELVVAIPRREEYNDLLQYDSLTGNDLIGRKILLREPGSGTRSLFERELRSAGNSLEQFKVSIFDNQETIKQAVRQAVGLTVISRFVVEEYADFGLLDIRPFTGQRLTREFWLVYHKKRVFSPAVSALYANLKTFFRQEAL
ncbi:MAG: HTH-type transcriptional regulator CysL [Dehalococcoidia bacterium]|nr:HTH-type transcriptional regulator CysL [Bacillota bacterium]MBT9141697.1 HTH-type transcriptional regulator CysL [Bacillota bacterium]